MPRHLQGWMAFALFIGVTGQASADYLFSHTYSGRGGTWGIHSQVRAVFAITPDAQDEFLAPLIDLYLTPDDVGKTFVADPSTPFFGTNIGFVTDGKNGRVFFADGTGGSYGGRGWFEKGFFYGAPHAPSEVGPFDLQGATIDRVTLKVLELTITSPGSDPNRNGVWTEHTFKGILTFEGQGQLPSPVDLGAGEAVGETPEPASLALALCGFVSAAGYVYRRRNRS